MEVILIPAGPEKPRKGSAAVTVYRRPDPIPLPHARPVHGAPRVTQAAPGPAATPPRVPVANLSERFARDLALGLMKGRYLRDGVLWTEPQLCEAFGISRTALREAIKILSAKGIVETRRKRGTILRRQSDWNLLDPDVIHWLLICDPGRTAAALAEAMTVLARAADETGRKFGALSGEDDIAAAIRRIGLIENPFLDAFAQTTGHALRQGAGQVGVAASSPLPVVE